MVKLVGKSIMRNGIFANFKLSPHKMLTKVENNNFMGKNLGTHHLNIVIKVTITNMRCSHHVLGCYGVRRVRLICVTLAKKCMTQTQGEM